MSIEFTKSNLDSSLIELAKEFRKLSKKSTPAEIVLIGGASILANYGFRNSTNDMDALISASSVMKEAINHAGDKLGLPNGWLNSDFKKTKSYSDRLFEVSVYYKTFSNILTIRTISAEYLIAMKLMSGRQYKFDLSDIIGILLEHQKNNKPLTLEMIKKATTILYGDYSNLPAFSIDFINDVFNNANLEQLYSSTRESENNAKSAVLDFNKANPSVANEDTINAVIEQAKKLRETKSKNGIYS